MTDIHPGFSSDEHRLMRRALELAARGLYSVDPNPRVGCVLLKNGQVIGEGWHRKAGGPHAEIEALNSCEESPRGGTAIVTLEPCSHFGRTPPCARALVDAGVAEVLIAAPDPSEKVNGRGVDMLREAGVLVRSGLLRDEAEALNPGFNSRAQRARPFVRLKVAASLDGRTGMANGDSNWITGPEARSDVQHFRARSSLILTGASTVRLDNPRLNVRPDALASDRRAAHDEPVLQPDRLILSRRPVLPQHLAITASGGRVYLCAPNDPSPAERSELDGLGVSFLDHSFNGASQNSVSQWPTRSPTQNPATSVDLTALLSALAEREYNEVMAECGATLAGALLREGLVDELVAYVAPCFLGSDARPFAVLPGISAMSDRIRMDLADVTSVGNDVRLILRPLNESATPQD